MSSVGACCSLTMSTTAAPPKAPKKAERITTWIVLMTSSCQLRSARVWIRRHHARQRPCPRVKVEKQVRMLGPLLRRPKRDPLRPRSGSLEPHAAMRTAATIMTRSRRTRDAHRLRNPPAKMSTFSDADREKPEKESSPREPRRRASRASEAVCAVHSARFFRRALIPRRNRFACPSRAIARQAGPLVCGSVASMVGVACHGGTSPGQPRR